MRRGSGADGGPNKPRSRTAMPRKPGNAPNKVARISSPTKTEVEGPAKTEAAQLALELQEARERQAATAEVLSDRSPRVPVELTLRDEGKGDRVISTAIAVFRRDP